MKKSRHIGGRWFRLTAGLAGTIVAVSFSSCNIVAPAAYIIGGLEKTDAVYELADRPTVIFVDDRRNIINGRVALRGLIAERASESLMENKIVTKTISPRDTMAVARQRDTASKPMAMDELARAVGAEQMVFIEMAEFALSPDGVTPRPTAACYVRVIDAANSTRLFPGPDSRESAYPLQVALREAGPEAYQSQATRRELEDRLARELGDRLAKLFYKHVPEDIGSRLTPG